ncbi:hypothetical protein PIB30_103858, partial [Stylosanthes scabra]|nr:hypothetical protein [Stylosanthes scabra]
RRRSSSWRLSLLPARGVPPQRLYIVPAFALARVTVPPFAVNATVVVLTSHWPSLPSPFIHHH